MSGTNSKSALPISAAPSATFDPQLVELLVCPVSRGPLQYDKPNKQLISKQAGLAFPVRDGVPILLEGEAILLDDERKL